MRSALAAGRRGSRFSCRRLASGSRCRPEHRPCHGRVGSLVYAKQRRKDSTSSRDLAASVRSKKSAAPNRKNGPRGRTTGSSYRTTAPLQVNKSWRVRWPGDAVRSRLIRARGCSRTRRTIPRVARRRIRRKVVIWLVSAAAAFLLAAFLLVFVVMVIAATFRAGH